MEKIVDYDFALSSTVIDRAINVFRHPLPPDVESMALDAVLDFVAVTLAAVHEPVGLIAAASLGEYTSQPGSVLIGRRLRATAEGAALVNGATAHALDYDDTNIGFLGHPTVPVLAAVLAAAEALECDGGTMLRAYVAGVEAECLLATLIGPEHYSLGWHSTATLGTFGAAMACALLEKQDYPVLLNTLGLAAIQAAGLKQAFGSMAKPLQVGIAAQSGMQAARWASAGMTGPVPPLEGPTGFAALHGSVPRRATGIDIDRWRILDNVFKFHATCFLTHSSIDACKAITSEFDFPVDQIEGITVEVSPTASEVCDRPEAVSGLDSKFSIQANIARALLGIDTAAPQSFAANAGTADLAALVSLTKVTTVEDFPVAQARVTVALKNSRILSRTEDADVPEPLSTGRRNRLIRKFNALTANTLHHNHGERLKDIILHELPTLPNTRQLMDVLSKSIVKEANSI